MSDFSEMQRVDARSISVWRWSAFAGWTPIVVGSTVAAVATSLAQAPPAPLFQAAAALAWCLMVLLVWWYPPARYRHLGYQLDDTGIRIQDGIVWRTQSAIPRVRIQHTDVSQGPLQRRYGVATLKLYTAGSRFTKVELPGVEYGEAVSLRDRLQRPSDDDAV